MINTNAEQTIRATIGREELELLTNMFLSKVSDLPQDLATDTFTKFIEWCADTKLNAFMYDTLVKGESQLFIEPEQEEDGSVHYIVNIRLIN